MAAKKTKVAPVLNINDPLPLPPVLAPSMLDARLPDEDGDEDSNDRGAITDEQMNDLAETITKPQIDRLLKLRAQIDRRDEYRKRGVNPREHIIVLSGAVHMYESKRRESRPGDILEIGKLDSASHDDLLEKELAEVPV